mgnify:CR=1 FL=1
MKLFAVMAILGIGGLFLAAIYTFIIGFAGAPGSIISTIGEKRFSNRLVWVLGVILTIAGQTYIAMAFAVLVINFVRGHFVDVSGFQKWILWTIAFFVANAPASYAVKDAYYAWREQQNNPQHIAIFVTDGLTVIGFFLCLFVPRLIEVGWGWVPAF